MHVYVTGGTGHSGPYIISDLLAAGHSVTALVRSDDGASTVERLGADAHVGSLDDLDGLKKAAAAADGVIHVAHRQDLLPAGGLAAVAAAEVEIMLAYGEALAGTGKPLVVSASIGSPTWEGLGHMVTEADPALPGGDTYAGTLRVRNIVETTAIELAERGVRSSVVRIPPVMHSDTDKAGFLPLLIGLAKQKGAIGYPGDGSNRWPAVHARDLAILFRLALEKGVAGSAWHAVADEGIPLANLVTLDLPASSLATRQKLGWQPVQPGLLEDLDNGHYFPAA